MVRNSVKFRTFPGVDSTLALALVNIHNDQITMTPPEKVDFIMSHMDGPAKEEVRMYSEKERSNPNFLLDVLARAFGEKRSSSQLLKMFYVRKQKENETLRTGYSYSLNELLKRITKADPKAVPDPEKTLRDKFADNVRDPFLRKELKKFIRERQPAFLDLREEPLRWSEEKERPQRARPPLSQEVAADIPDESSQCSAASSVVTPMDKLLEVLLKQQKSLEELTSSIRDLKHPRTQIPPKEWSRQRPNIVCFKCNKNGHIARNCRVNDDRLVRKGPPQGRQRPDKL